MKKLIILGSSGRLGAYFKKKLKSRYKLFSFGKKKKKYDIDFLKEKQIEKIINKIAPDIILNCAGATNVNKCIRDYEYAFKGNVIIPRNIKKALIGYKKNKVHIVHFSTDQVYNSKKNRSLESKCKITNNYSKTKFYGEKEIRKVKNHTIIRTNFFGNLMSERNNSFSDFIIKNLKKKNKIKIASNIYYNPIDIKKLTVYLKKILNKNIIGTYNIGGEKIFSKYEFALKV